MTHEPGRERHMVYRKDETEAQPTLEELLELSRRTWAAMTPEEREAMLRKQAEGWARSEAQWAKDFAEGKCERD